MKYIVDIPEIRYCDMCPFEVGDDAWTNRYCDLKPARIWTEVEKKDGINIYRDKPSWCPLKEAPNFDLIAGVKPDYVRGMRKGLSYEETERIADEAFSKLLEGE